MNVVITGATGFIGRAVSAALRSRGDTVVGFTRDPSRAKERGDGDVKWVAWDPSQPSGAWEDSLATADAVVHLAGEPVVGKRWDSAQKARILESRVLGTRHVVNAILRNPRAPKVFISASGMDYYGDTGDRPVDETDASGSGFLAETCVAWEAETQRVAASGAREVRLRISLVLGETGGALGEMAMPFKFFVGGPVGSGKQWVSWIHHKDIVRIIVAAIDNNSLKGPVNCATPSPARMRDFSRALGRALGRPSWAPVPTFVLRLVLGEAGPIIAESKRLVPRALEEIGFRFEYPELEAALRASV